MLVTPLAILIFAPAFSMEGGKLGTMPQKDKIVNSIDTIVSDMREIGEAKPHGVPDSVGWSLKPRVQIGNDPGKWSAFIPWGQVYETVEGNPAKNSRVEIRSLRGFILSKRDQKWREVSATIGNIFEGAAYAEDFANDRNKPADAKYSPNAVIVGAGEGYNYHFWPKDGRVTIDPSDVGGVLVTAQARLVLADPKGPDDRSSAQLIMSVGGDYWEALTSQWDNFKTNGDVGIGRFKFVRNHWRAFNMCTLSGAELRKNPPPIE